MCDAADQGASGYFDHAGAAIVSLIRLEAELDSAKASIGSISLDLVTAPTTGAVVLGKKTTARGAGEWKNANRDLSQVATIKVPESAADNGTSTIAAEAADGSRCP